MSYKVWWRKHKRLKLDYSILVMNDPYSTSHLILSKRLSLSYLITGAYLILSRITWSSHIINLSHNQVTWSYVIQLWHHHDIIGLDHNIIMTSSWHHCWLMNSLTVIFISINSIKTYCCVITHFFIISSFIYFISY